MSKNDGDSGSSHFSLRTSNFDQPQEIGERAFESAVRVVKLCRVLDQSPGVSRTLANQLLRSGTSIGANLEESKGGQNRADYVSKVSIALKESRETHYWLRLLVAMEVIVEGQLAPLIDEADQIVAILTTIVKKLKGQWLLTSNF
jgi:four helix bundle protein